MRPTDPYKKISSVLRRSDTRDEDSYCEIVIASHCCKWSNVWSMKRVRITTARSFVSAIESCYDRYK